MEIFRKIEDFIAQNDFREFQLELFEQIGQKFDSIDLNKTFSKYVASIDSLIN